MCVCKGGFGDSSRKVTVDMGTIGDYEDGPHKNYMYIVVYGDYPNNFKMSS